jgi:hypothetical protein
MTYEDAGVEAGKYWYRLDLVASDGSHTLAGPLPVRVGDGGSLPTAITSVNVPANGPIEIRFSLADGQGPARLAVFDVAGRRVKSLDADATRPGSYLVTWDGLNQDGERAARGVYVLALRAGKTADSAKLVLVRE